MAFYAEEEEVWKCPTHPSKRRKTGICPTCLKDRLGALCSECATARPCACCPATETPSSSSSSSSFFLFSAFGSRRESLVGSVGRVSNLVDGEPAFLRRSRSVAIPFLRSRFADRGQSENPIENRRKSFFWSVFKTQHHDHHKGRKCGENEGEDEESHRNGAQALEAEDNSIRRMMMRRSRSVASGIRDIKSVALGVFRHSKPKVLHDRSPLYRG